MHNESLTLIKYSAHLYRVGNIIRPKLIQRTQKKKLDLRKKKRLIFIQAWVRST